MSSKAWILAVEDDNHQRKWLKHVLESRYELKVVAAENGKLGQVALETAKSAPILMVLDLNIPIIAGVELIRYFVDKEQELPPTVIWSAQEHVEQLKIPGFSPAALIQKPCEAEHFFQATDPLVPPTARKDIALKIKELEMEYRAGLKHEIAELRRLIQNGENDAIRNFLHRIAGSAGTFRLANVSMLAKAIEQEFGSGKRYPELGGDFDTLIEMLENAAVDLKVS